MDKEIEATLRAYIREQCLPQAATMEFEDTRNFFESGILDSAGLISFVGFIEVKFNLKIPDEDLVPAHFVSIASTADYIRSKQESRPAFAPLGNGYVGSEEMHRLGPR
jgi:acyl carrier protein